MMVHGSLCSMQELKGLNKVPIFPNLTIRNLDVTDCSFRVNKQHEKVKIKTILIYLCIQLKDYKMTNNSVTLHRVLKATPEKVYRAFTEPKAISFWLPPYGFLCEVHQMDARAGGSYKMSFTNFSTGNGHSFGGDFLEIKPNEFIKHTDKFDDPNLPGEMITSIWLKKVSVGTELKIVQEGIPSVIPTEMCYLGWQESLEKLAKLVEPEIPDA